MGEGAERRLCIDLPCPPRLQVLILPVGALRDEGHQVQYGAGDEEPTSLPPLCFLPRPWGGQSCPDLAQGQGSTSKVSLKVGENPRVGVGRGAEALGRGWAGPENPDLQVRQLQFSPPFSARDSLCDPGHISPHF